MYVFKSKRIFTNLLNYYKILGLQNYAEIDEVKNAYRQKAKIYHPDLNNNANNTEIMKLLNEAYDHLETPQKKSTYDYKLKYALAYENIRKNRPKVVKPKSSPTYFDKAKFKQMLIQKSKYERLQELKAFENKNQKFPYNFRLIGAIVLLLFGMQLFYSYYFVNELKSDFLLVFLGVLIIVLSCFAILSISYTIWRNKDLKSPLKFNYEKRIFIIFIALLIVPVLSIYSLNNYRKSYHLSHFSKIVVGKINYYESIKHVAVVYEFKEKYYQKTFNLSKNSYYSFADNWVLVKLSEADPRIATVRLSKNDKIPRE